IYTDKEGWGFEMKKRLKPRGNEKTSAVGNMLMRGSKAKRKRSDSNNCHQCHRRDKERVVRCTKCNQKNYCIPCITRWYPTMEEIDCAEACPVCRDICNCAACLQSNAANRVNVLMHTAAICISPEWVSTMELAMKSQQGERGNEKAKGRRQDVPKLEEYLRGHYGELRHIDSRLHLAHPIHDKAFYLTEEHKRNLIEEYEFVHTFTISQNDLVTWLMGSQLSDIRGKEDSMVYLQKHFVTKDLGRPSRVQVLLLTLFLLKVLESASVYQENTGLFPPVIDLRKTSYRIDNKNSCSKVQVNLTAPMKQVKKMAFHAMRRAVKYLENATADKSRSRPTPPLALRDVPHVAPRDVPRVAPRDVPVVAPRDVPVGAPRDVPQNPAVPEIMTVDLGFIREDLEAKKLLLDREGHFVAPQQKEYLDDEINNLLDIIYAVTEPAP
ncbi:hypothetical protein Sango_1840400, partial [Sesamum angolense]